MNFRTQIVVSRSPWSIGYDDRIMLLGSCFADNMADKLGEYFFRLTVNPTGTLYNPISVARHVDDVPFDVAVITFGTAWVYEENGQVVDNCQKRPSSCFTRRKMSVEEIVDVWRPILSAHKHQRFLFTVSPIRHLKDGLHENQLSKSTLLLAVDELVRSAEGQAGRVGYFPSYEIVLDDLRDYRFYGEDMMHPSKQAVEYIFEQFQQAYLYEQTTQAAMQELHQLYLDMQHRPLKPDSEESHAFHAQLLERQQVLQQKYPQSSIHHFINPSIYHSNDCSLRR